MNVDIKAAEPFIIRLTSPRHCNAYEWLANDNGRLEYWNKASPRVKSAYRRLDKRNGLMPKGSFAVTYWHEEDRMRIYANPALHQFCIDQDVYGD